MARTGRPRKPTVLKILEGNPGRRPLNESEPEYEPKVEKPDDLTPTASAWWDRVVPSLVRLRLAQNVDQPALVLLANDYAGWDRASRLYMSQPPLVMRGSTKVPVLDDLGEPIYDGEGDERKQRIELRPILVSSPLLRAVKDFGAAYRQGAQAFGLTAASRSTLSIPDRTFEDLEAGFDEWQADLRRKEAREAGGGDLRWRRETTSGRTEITDSLSDAEHRDELKRVGVWAFEHVAKSEATGQIAAVLNAVASAASTEWVWRAVDLEAASSDELRSLAIVASVLRGEN